MTHTNTKPLSLYDELTLVSLDEIADREACKKARKARKEAKRQRKYESALKLVYKLGYDVIKFAKWNVNRPLAEAYEVWEAEHTRSLLEKSEERIIALGKRIDENPADKEAIFELIDESEWYANVSDDGTCAAHWPAYLVSERALKAMYDMPWEEVRDWYKRH